MSKSPLQMWKVCSFRSKLCWLAKLLDSLFVPRRPKLKISRGKSPGLDSIYKLAVAFVYHTLCFLPFWLPFRLCPYPDLLTSRGWLLLGLPGCTLRVGKQLPYLFFRASCCPSSPKDKPFHTRRSQSWEQQDRREDEKTTQAKDESVWATMRWKVWLDSIRRLALRINIKEGSSHGPCKIAGFVAPVKFHCDPWEFS